MSFVVRAVSKWYFNKLTDRLAKLGLTYHDAIAETGVYDKAVSRLPPRLLEARAQRMKRAMDMSAKHTEVPVDQRVSLRRTTSHSVLFVQIADATSFGGQSNLTLNLRLVLQVSPWREYRFVERVFSETQKEVDERKFLAGRWWMPYHIGRETWCVGVSVSPSQVPPKRLISCARSFCEL